MRDMSQMNLTKTSLTAGVWQGVLQGGGDAPRLTVTHLAEVLDPPELTADGDVWHVSIAIPADRISDGVQTFVIADADTGSELGSFALAVGDALAQDIRAEVDLLRAELDLLKKAFRRHCVETEQK